MRWSGIRSVVVVLALCSVGLAACGDDDDSAGSTTTVAAVAGTSSTASSASDGITQATTDVGVKYTGGKAGAADDGLEPLKVGFVLQKGGTPSFPEQEGAADATTQFINEHLGGIAGHPLELVKCFMQSEEAGQKCAADLLAAGVPVANQAIAVVGNTSLYKTVAGKFPFLVGTTATPTDQTSDDVYALTGGGTAVLFAIANNVQTLGGHQAALIAVDNVGGKYGMEKIAVPALDQLGIAHNKTVYYPGDATTPDLVSAIQAAGASKADAIIMNPSAAPQCISLFDALKQLGIDKPVITTPTCNDDSFVEHAGGTPENWNLWGFNENPRIEGSPDVDAYNNIMQAYGQEKYSNIGFASSTVRDLLTIAKLGNALGSDNLTPAGFREQILAFPGPAFLVPGKQSCANPPDPTAKSVCGNTAVGSTFKDGRWQSLGATTNELEAVAK